MFFSSSFSWFHDKTDNSRLFSNAVVTDRFIVFFAILFSRDRKSVV